MVGGRNQMEISMTAQVSIFEKHTERRYAISCAGCGADVSYASKAGALSALTRKTCRACRVDYRAKELPVDAVYKNAEGKWCSKCPSCKDEQAYTRMDHAKTSHASGWRCKACASQDRAFSSTLTGYEGDIRLGWYRRFEKSAADRGLRWELSAQYLNSLWAQQDGRCALSGVQLDNKYATETVSIDRIDSDKGYVVGNVQLVHKVLNLMKRHMPDEEFVAWCKLVAENFN